MSSTTTSETIAERIHRNLLLGQLLLPTPDEYLAQAGAVSLEHRYPCADLLQHWGDLRSQAESLTGAFRDAIEAVEVAKLEALDAEGHTTLAVEMR